MKLAAFPKCYMDALCVERSMSIFDWIRIVRDHLKPLGVSGVETYHGSLVDWSPDYLSRVRAAHDEAGLVAPMFCSSPDFTSPDPAHRAAEIGKQRRMIDAAFALGAESCRVLSGQRRPEVGRRNGVDWVLECIAELLPYAEERSVVLVMENHFKDNYWEYPEFAQRMDIFCEIVEQIDSPWFGVNFDPSNTFLAGEDPLQLLDRVKHRVICMHASDRRPRPGINLEAGSITDYSQLVHGEIGTGLIDYDSIFRILGEVGFDGWVSIEDGVNGIEELERSAAFLASKMRLAGH